MRILSAGCLSLAILATATPPTFAASRPDTRSMTCAEVRQLVRQRGAVLLTTDQHTYGRYVSGQAYCESGLYANYSPVVTRDAKACDAGYMCTASEPFPSRN